MPNKIAKISDDEDDTHPNIDTGSLHRMRHNHRVEQQMNLEGSIQGLEYDIEQLKVKIDVFFAIFFFIFSIMD